MCLRLEADGGKGRIRGNGIWGGKGGVREHLSLISEKSLHKLLALSTLGQKGEEVVLFALNKKCEGLFMKAR